jgi:hypothetical protein
VQPLTDFDEWLASPLWWNAGVDTIGPAFSKNRAAALHRAGAKRMLDIWCDLQQCYIPSGLAPVRFGLKITEQPAWDRICVQLTGIGRRLQQRGRSNPQDGDWFDLYAHPIDPTPLAVIQRKHIPYVQLVHQVFISTTTEELFKVRLQSQTLLHIHAADSGAAVLRIAGFPARVRVISVPRGPKKVQVLFFYGRVRDLSFDPARLVWSDKSNLLAYTTQKGRALLCNQHSPPAMAATKWNVILPPDFKFQWAEVWDTKWAQKEATLL